MVWLGGWLKQLILVVMLAAFVDLMLPNQAMQRYAKTVIGLFMLLVLLTPVFEIFQKHWDADKLIAEAENLQQSKSMLASADGIGPKVADGKGTDSLNRILEQSEQLKKSSAKQAMQLAETRIAEEMKVGLEKNEGLPVEKVVVTLMLDDKGNPAIRHVQVTLSNKKEPPDAGKSSGGSGTDGKASVDSPIGEVKPVVIDIPPIKNESVTRKGTEASALEEADNRVRQTVGYMGREWQVPKDRIEVVLSNR